MQMESGLNSIRKHFYKLCGSEFSSYINCRNVCVVKNLVVFSWMLKNRNSTFSSRFSCIVQL